MAQRVAVTTSLLLLALLTAPASSSRLLLPLCLPACSLLPAPSALGARLLRQAAMVDLDLTVDTLRAQLFDRVVLFAPFAATRDATAPEAAALRRLQRRVDAATGALKKMCAS